MSDANSYYKKYYTEMGDAAYLGEKLKQSSRMLVFCEWLRAELKPGAKVLDIGCGDAIFAELMPEFEWYGVDINVEKATKRIPAERLKTHDLMVAPYDFQTGMFDAVITSEVLEHVWDLRIVHKEVKRLLKRDGIYVISTPNWAWLQNLLEHHTRLKSEFDLPWQIEHIRHYDFDLHKKYLNEVGFVVEKHTGSCGHYDPVTANICRAIRDGLRAKGVETDENELHVFAGRGIPHLSHTTIIASKKA